MKLTKLQNHIALTMRHSGLSEDKTATLMCGLETEQQQWAMLDWMDAYYDETGSYPKEAPICKAMAMIRERYPTPESVTPSPLPLSSESLTTPIDADLPLRLR